MTCAGRESGLARTWRITGISEIKYVGLLRGQISQFLVGDLFEFQWRLADFPEQRRALLNIDGTPKFGDDGEVPDIVVFIHKFIGIFAEGQDCRITKINRDVGLLPRANPGRDADGLGW